MKFRILLLTAIASLGSTYAEVVKIEDLPVDVRETITATIPVGRLDDVTVKLSQNGERYVAKLKLKGEGHLLVYVSSEGELIQIRRDFKFKNLPNRVRDAVEQRIENTDHLDIQKVTKNGQVRYVITLQSNDSNEPDVVLVITPNGKILKSEENLNFNEISNRVRKVINKILDPDWEIKSVTRRLDQGETTYVIIVERKNNTRIQLTFDSNGLLIDTEEICAVTT